MAHPLSHRDAGAFYDHFGSRQDRQGFYENAAIDELLRHGAFDKAGAVLEFGCGTGKFAARLLADYLPAGASYLGLDISRTMVALARRRLGSWRGRASVRRTRGTMRLTAGDGTVDRVIAAYVLDLLNEDDIATLVAETHRVLKPGGLLCVAGLARGTTLASRAVSWTIHRIWRLNPRLTGGCRPLDMGAFLSSREWRVVHSRLVSPCAIASQAIVAERLGGRRKR